MATADSMERIARSRAFKKESDFQAASRRQQAAFQDAQKNIKTRAAAKNIGDRKFRAASMMAGAVLPDVSSPQNFAVSLIPGGKIVNTLAKSNKAVNKAYEGGSNVGRVNSFVENARRPRP